MKELSGNFAEGCGIGFCAESPAAQLRSPRARGPPSVPVHARSTTQISENLEGVQEMNAYHLSAHGILYSFGDEEPMRFSGGLNCQWPGYPADPNRTGKCKAKIVLN